MKYDLEITVGNSLYMYENINKNIVLIGNGVSREDFAGENIKKHPAVYKILFVGRLDEFK